MAIAPNHVRIYFSLMGQYFMASCWTQDKNNPEVRSYSEPADGERLFYPFQEGERLVQKGLAVLDANMTAQASGMFGKRSASIGAGGAPSGGALHMGKIQMNVTPHADTDGVVCVGWNTMISYLDSDASIIKTSDTVIGGDFTTNTLLHLCALSAYGKLVIKEIEFNGSAEGVFAAAAPSYIQLNVLGEKKDKKMPFPQPSSKDTDNTIRVYTQKYLAELGVELEFKGFEYFKFTTPKGLSSIVTFTLEFQPRG